VPKSARLPPQAGIAAGELENANPTCPTPAIASTWYAATPKWLLLAMPTKDTPYCFERSIASRTAMAQA
jgi:hypothetical protein